ncbi:hypothetical protein C1645_840580 [Glomus cerebriforme]|uniref:HAT C-terminal dimerisation domain-containing protein n=1 Tax=Glomus cerebriforme TaxID=658196 RepID=A0A397S0M9_9GLOM|nr:hypothetical protein C1645_840580 [Glomus cerebriforme]
MQKEVEIYKDLADIQGNVLNKCYQVQSIDSLREVNARLLIEISELRRKFAEVETENAKLKQIIEEMQVDDQLYNEAISKRFVKQTSFVIDQQNNDDAKISEKKKMNAFLVEINKKSISDKIKESRQEKKIQNKMIAKDSSSITSDLTYYEEDFSIISTELVTLSEQVVKESILACKSITSGNKSSAGTSPVKLSMVNKQTLTFENTETECQKIPYNQKVEQDLRRELSFTKVDNGNINKTFDIQISELSLEAILIESSKVIVQNIVDLFRVAMKLRHKKILCWYCYYKAYEDRVRNVKSKNGVDDKSARILVYSEIKFLLPNITDIQNIINDFSKKATNTDDIGYEDSVSNWNGHMTSKTNKTEIQANPLGVNILANQLTLASIQAAADLKKQVIEDLIEAFAIADIPLEKVNSLLLFFKKHVKNGGSIPQAPTLRQIYLPNIFERHHQSLKSFFDSNHSLENLIVQLRFNPEEFYVIFRLAFEATYIFDPKYIYTGNISRRDIRQYNAIHKFANPSDELLREWEICCGLGNSEILGKIELNQYWLNKVIQLLILSKITLEYIWLPISSCSIERSFSMYNSLLDSNCQNLSQNSPKKLNMIYFNGIKT